MDSPGGVVISALIGLSFAAFLLSFPSRLSWGMVKTFCCVYLTATVAVLGFSSNYFLRSSGVLGSGIFEVNSLNFPLIFAISMSASAVLFYAVLKGGCLEFDKRLLHAVPLAACMGILALSSREAIPHSVFLLAALMVAAYGLTGLRTGELHGKGRFISFWALGDVLTAVACVLCVALLKEKETLIIPPLLSGSDVQVGVIVFLSMAGALVKTGLFPFSVFHGRLFSRSETPWSVFFQGCLCFALGAHRLAVSVSMNANFVRPDLSAVMLAVAAFSAVAGALMILMSGDLEKVVSGSFAVLSGLIFAAFSMNARVTFSLSLFMTYTAPACLFALLSSLGAARDVAGSISLNRAASFLRASPGYAASLLVSGLSLGGVPLTEGFASRVYTAFWGLFSPGRGLLQTVLAALLLVSTLLVLLGFIRIALEILALRGPQEKRRIFAPLETLVPVAASLSVLFFGIFPRVVVRFSDEGLKLLIRKGMSLPSARFTWKGAAFGSFFSSYEMWSLLCGALASLIFGISLLLYFAAKAGDTGD